MSTLEPWQFSAMGREDEWEIDASDAARLADARALYLQHRLLLVRGFARAPWRGLEPLRAAWRDDAGGARAHLRNHARVGGAIALGYSASLALDATELAENRAAGAANDVYAWDAEVARVATPLGSSGIGTSKPFR